MSGHEIVQAAIFLPTHVALDAAIARECLAHVERRGYELRHILRTWAEVLQVFNAHEVDVVVFGRVEHLDPAWTPRCEFVGHETRDVAAYQSDGRLRGRRNGRPRLVS